MEATEFDTTQEDAAPPLLLHSLAEFRELILTCLDASGARTVVEIGSEDGTFSRELVKWAHDRDARVYCVDPAPGAALVEFAAGSPRVELVLERSLDALEHLEACDAYLIDGDHNHYTVAHELQAIAARALRPGPHPLVFLHDVGWPAGRRDMYYVPESIPADARHEHAYDKGTVPWSSELVEGGFRGAGRFAWAVTEGGPRNGVLTAVEEFLAARPELAFVTVPCIFGLGVVYDSSAPYAGEVARVLGRYDGDVLLRRLEDNRLRLYLRVLEAQDEMSRLRDELARSSLALEKSTLHIRDVAVENRALWARVAELEDELAAASRRQGELVEEVRRLLPSGTIAVAERLSRLHGRVRNRPVVSFDRLRALAGDATE